MNADQKFQYWSIVVCRWLGLKAINNLVGHNEDNYYKRKIQQRSILRLQFLVHSFLEYELGLVVVTLFCIQSTVNKPQAWMTETLNQTDSIVHMYM